MRKTIINSLVLAVSLLCLLVLGACPPEADTTPAESTTQVEITNIPSKVNEKDTYKVYVLFSEGMSATAGHVARGEATLTAGQTTVTITDLKDTSGNNWTDSNFKSVCVLITAQTVSSEDDTDAHGSLVSPSKTLSLDWDSLMKLKGNGAMIPSEDYTLLYNGIIGNDSAITKSP
jgi:hypothetical protein